MVRDEKFARASLPAGVEEKAVAGIAGRRLDPACGFRTFPAKNAVRYAELPCERRRPLHLGGGGRTQAVIHREGVKGDALAPARPLRCKDEKGERIRTSGKGHSKGFRGREGGKTRGEFGRRDRRGFRSRGSALRAHLLPLTVG